MEVWEGVDHEVNTKTRGSKYNITYVHPHIYINKRISPIFNCVIPESVSLTSLARQLSVHSIMCNVVFVLRQLPVSRLNFASHFLVLVNALSLVFGQMPTIDNNVSQQDTC